MDDITKANRERWNDLADAGVQHSVPFYKYSLEEARDYVCRYDILNDVHDLKVLCLGGGGGQDSVAFGLLGAKVTVLDLSDIQLARDKEAAIHHGLQVEAIQGDMQDLSVFDANSFDVVWQPFSLNYSPSVVPVFNEVSRVLRDRGIYFVAFANPFMQAMDDDSWNGEGYLLKGAYIDGEDISKYSPHWSVPQTGGSTIEVKSPHQFRHTLSTVTNNLAKSGFTFLYLKEWMRSDSNPELGSWAHFTQAAPPWFDSFWQLHK